MTGVLKTLKRKSFQPYALIPRTENYSQVSIFKLVQQDNLLFSYIHNESIFSKCIYITDSCDDSQ